MVEVVPSDAGTSTETNDRNGDSGRNSPASAVCYQEDSTLESQTTRDGAQSIPTSSHEVVNPSIRPAADHDSTPHSKASSVNGPLDDNHHDEASFGFLSPVSSQDAPPPSLNTSTAVGSIVEPTVSNDGSISHLDLTSIASSSHIPLPHRFDHHLERPMPHHTYSSTSTASTATIRASDHTSRLPESETPQKRLPTFPNQSYTALQTQQHPPPHPPYLRSRSSNPSPYLSYVSGAKAQLDHASSTPSGSRTAGNSPSGSPGLFTPAGSPVRPRSVADDVDGSYSSPFLHYTQRHVPKETHVADIDVDPISGRKIINQYEIVDELGRGVHGKVKLGRILPSGTFVAIKIVERYSKKKRLGKNTSHEDKIKKEIAILKKARHPNIVSLSEVIDDPQWKKVYIVLEFVELGEVAWRESGPDDICLIEYRRYLRQSHGIQETEATAAEEHQILDEGRQKREKARRRELKQKLKDRVEGSSSESWSFEHFGEGSDIDESNFDALSYTSSTTSGSHQDTSDPNGKVDALSIPPPHLLPPPVPDDTQTADFATITGLTEATEVMKEQSDQFASGDEFDTVTATGLEGTMYGAYDDLARGRTPSVAGSSSSHIFEDFHRTHVPEHFKYVPLLTLSQARSCFRDTVLGLEYLHFQGVIHRDIKPANLLQTKDHRIKISDFGVSYLGRERSSTDPNESESEAPGIDEAVELAKTVGTPAFYAPELCHTDTDGPMWPVTQQIDVWALGVTLYCLVFGRVPFHDHNPFALMAKIAEEEVHIPRERLKAVEKGSTSRPSSRGRMLQSRSSKRDPFRLEYEAIDDDLYDLLRRLFIKDPRRRINLTEVKHHPWVLMGISNPYIWLEETDPTRDSATKIQVSQEDVADAVAQLNIYERVLRKIGNTFGIGRSSSNRARTKSSATDPNAATLSPAGSSSSTISQDGRRGSVKPDESISAALRAAKEIDHPLAQSQTASPELYEQSHYFAHILGPPSGSEYSDFEADQYGETSRSSRPMLSERANSAGSSSNKTLRPKDVTKSLGLGSLGMGNMTFPALPSTPRTLDSPGANLGGIFGGAGRSLMRKFGRSRDRSAADNDDDARDRSLDRASVDRLTDTSDDLHAEPSLAISDTVASGLLRQPDLPHSQSSSAMPSPVSSRAASITSPDLSYHGKQGPSRQSSISSASSALRRPLTASKDAPEHMTHYFSGTHPADEFDMAREEYFRRRMVEEQQLQDRPPSAGQSLPQHIQGACPPSPDDEMFHRKQQEDVMARPRSATYDPSATHHYVSNTPSLPASRLFTSSSSEDHFASGLSQSTSNPSIPSVVSADSSLMPDMGDERALDLTREPKESLVDPPSDGSTIYTRSSEQRHKEPSHEDDDGYAGDGDAAVESADSDSDDDFIEMTSRKGRDRSKGYSRSESISVGELGRRRARRTNGTGKAARSESNGTMKKIRSRSMSGDEEILKTAQSS